MILRQRDFRRLWLAGLVSDTGDWLLLISLPIVVYELTGSTLGTAVAFLVELVPPVVLAPLSGHLADRYDRRRLLLFVSIGQAAALAPLLAVHGRSDLPIVYGVIALESTLAALFDPAKNALLPTLVKPGELVSANSLIGLNQNVGRLAGASLGGLVLAAGGLSAVVAIDGASFLIATGLLACLGTAASVPAPKLTEPGRAGRLVFGSSAVRGILIVVFTASVAQGIFVALFVVFVAQTLHGGPTQIGVLRGVQAIGSIAAGLMLVTFGRAAPWRLAAFGATSFGVLCLVIWNLPTLTTSEPIFLLLFVAVGAPGMVLFTGLISSLQQATTNVERGKAFAAVAVAESIGQAIGLVGGGVLGDPVGVVRILDAQALLYLAAGALAALFLSKSRLPDQGQAPSVNRLVVREIDAEVSGRG